MKLIHTADWHLGKTLKEQSLIEDQEWILTERFLPLADEEAPGAVVLAGDVYDQSVPPETAVELFDRVTEEIVGKRKIPMIVISGNHDSAQRLAVAGRLLRREGLYIFGPLTKLEPVFLRDEFGEIAFLPMPYADPARVRSMLNALDLPGAEEVKTFEDAARALLSRVESLIPEEKKDCRRVAVAHLFAAGGVTSDSERPLSVGGQDAVPDSVFEGLTYAALGHLHGPQRTSSGKDNIRYSGSLLRYSFSEVRQQKGVLVADIGAEGLADIRFREMEPLRNVRALSGKFDDIMAGEGSEDYVEVTLTDESPVMDAMPRLREKFPHALSVVQDMGFRARDKRRPAGEHLTDEEILERFAEQYREKPLSEEEKEIVRSVWEAVYEKEAAK